MNIINLINNHNLIRSQIKTMMMSLFFVHFNISVFAQDAAISVNPTYMFFADEAPGDQSNAALITIKNEAYFNGLDIGSITLTGVNYGDFFISSDTCSGQKLDEDTTCTVQVKFAPQSTGTKSALITIPYGPTEENLTTVYLSNHEDTAHEAKRRLPPVVFDLSIPETMNASDSYVLNWTAMGYHSGYKTTIAMFDCTDITVPNCGAEYGSANMFHESDILLPSQTELSDWTYSSETAKNFQYTFTFNVNPTRPNSEAWDPNGTPIVIRFYVKSDEDASAEKTSLSMIIPGGLSNEYYDTSGRKIQKIICPEGGCIGP